MKTPYPKVESKNPRPWEKTQGVATLNYFLDSTFDRPPEQEPTNNAFNAAGSGTYITHCYNV